MHHCLQYGLGDIFRTIYRNNGWFSRVKDASKDYDISIYICSHNQYAIDIFKYFSYVNFVNTKWNHKHPPYKQFAKKSNSRFVDPSFFDNRYKSQPVTMILNKREQDKFDKITSKPVIVIHPFAGDISRMPISSRKYHKLVESLKIKTNSNIVILGGSYIRGKRLKVIPSKNIRESFNIRNMPNVYNLVGKISTRLSAKLTESAECFIGNWSAYSCIAWEKQVPMIMFTGPNGYKEFMRRRSNRFSWHKKCIAINAKNKNGNVCFKRALDKYEEFTKTK